MYKHLTSIILATTLWALPAPGVTETTMLMAEEPGCIYCARWNEEIGPIYDKTGEGTAAPLRRMDITNPVPDDITLARSINFTPTFVLLVDGTEVSRLEGYPGEDFFWGVIGMMLDESNISFDLKTLDGGDGT